MSTDLPPMPAGVKCGCLPRLSFPGQHLPILGEFDSPPLVPRPQMRDVDLSPMDAPVVHQGNQNSCTAASFVTAYRHARAVAGLSTVDLAWSTLYGPANAGRDSGSPLDVVIAQLMRVGVCPTHVGGDPYIDPFDWQGFYNGSWPNHWIDVAKGYRLLEAWDCPSVDHLLSALHAGCVCPTGVFWPGGGGHCVSVVGWDNAARKAKIQNSWGPSWAENGYGWISEKMLQQGLPYFGSFAVRVPTIAPVDPLPPMPH